MMLAILFSLKTMDLLKNGLQTHFKVIPLFLMRTGLFYPWVMYLLTVRITEAFGLPKPSLFCNVQRDVASLPSYSKTEFKLKSRGTYLVTDWLLIIT